MVINFTPEWDLIEKLPDPSAAGPGDVEMEWALSDHGAGAEEMHETVNRNCSRKALMLIQAFLSHSKLVSDRNRKMIRRRFYDDVPYREIDEEFGVSKGYSRAVVLQTLARVGSAVRHCSNGERMI